MLNVLEGTRVIDLSSVVLGPYATQMLGDLGADVIKVEPPSGDIFRHIAPRRHPGMGAGFLNVNRNKRSVCLDLKDPGDRPAFEKLVAGADVLIHNMRPTTAQRLGIDFEPMHRLNPRLVHCSAVGFGGNGPYADLPTYDDVVQAESGITRLNAAQDGQPRFIPTVIADKIGALFTSQGILSALLNRERTGKGMAVEAPMFECLVNFLLIEHMNGRVFDVESGHAGYDRLLNPFHKPYPTRDGHIVVIPYSTRHWIRVMRVFGRDDLAEAQWVLDDGLRSQRIAELYALLAENLGRRTTADWITALRDVGVPCAAVNELGDLFDHEHLRAAEFFQSCEHPSEGRITAMRYPLRFQGAAQRPDTPVPSLGQHTQQIMAELGFDSSGQD